MKTGIIYCRVSTKKQENDGDSLENQEKACRTYCKNNSIQIVGVFKEAFTGKEKIRPIFDEAINNAKENKVNYFIIFDIDRFSREGYGVYTELKEKLFDNGTKLKDSRNIIGDNNIVIQNNIVDMGQYKWNIENTSEYAEVMISTQAKIEGKKIIQRTIPREIQLEQMGYQVRQANFGLTNKKIKTSFGKATIQKKHYAEGEWMVEIFNNKAKGLLNDKEIVEQVNLKGCLKRKNIRLTKDTPMDVKYMQELIKNPIYCGVIKSKWTGYNTIKTPYEGLVSIDTWE